MTPRSWLFVPGDDARKLEKSLGSGADALIVDLEDSVTPARKPEARRVAADFLARPAPMPRFVRVNALDTGLTEADVAAVAPAGPEGYVLPKCEGRADLDRLSALLDRHGAHQAGIVSIATETVRALRRLLREDWSHPRLVGLTWGGEDLAADLGATANRDAAGAYLGPFRLAREAALLAAKEAGVAAIDSVFTDFRDFEGLAAEAREGAATGFDGKLAIHPAQVAPIQAAFTPSDESVAWARRVIEATENAGAGVASLDGRMIDAPHVKTARKILGIVGEG